MKLPLRPLAFLVTLAPVALAGPPPADVIRATVAHADLDYTTPATRSDEGQPIGNGRMGSLIWTTPTTLRFQINRVDVFAAHSGTVSFPAADSDYAAGCAYLDIHVASAGEDVFAGEGFRQQLSVYDALSTVQGRGVTARVLAWHERDIMAIEVDDQRAQPEPINIDLRMLRYAVQRITGKNHELEKSHAVEVHTAEHTARSQLHVRNGRIALTQQFSERKYYNASGVAVAVVGRPSRARFLNEATVQLSAAAGRGKFTILVGGAATFDAQKDIAAAALTEIDAALAFAPTAPAGAFEALHASNRTWWSEFWSRGFVRLQSADGQADFVGAHYTYFLYLMGASSRGGYPPRFGGMLWRTNGDLSRWGSQYWWANTSAYYRNLMPANRLELTDPLFTVYGGMLDSCATAARQQWGAQGIYIPETVFHDGLETLPDEIAAELQALMLVRKPYADRSSRFQWFASSRNRHHSRWNFQGDGYWDEGHWVVPSKGGQRSAGDGGTRSEIFGHTSHILSVAARIGALGWQRYQFTQDEAWLRDRAYPIIRGAAEFYRTFPNLRKGEDGKYHIHHLNNGESAWNSTNPPNEVNAMHLIFPIAIRAAEILSVDPELRAAWIEIKANLVELPANRRGRSGGGGTGGGGFGAFVYGGEGAIEPLGDEQELKARFLNFNRLASFIDEKGIGGAQIFRNRLRLREGPGAIDAEHIGGLSHGVHQTLLNSTPPAGEQDEPVLRVFDSWPRSWDAEFTLLARGAFLVTAAQEAGRIGAIEIVSQAGSRCRLINPWGEAEVQLARDGRLAERLRGARLEFSTTRAEKIVLAPSGG